MKKFILLLTTVVLATTLSYGQAPQKFNYQGIARDNAGTPLARQSLGLRISLLNNASGGTELYVETQTVMTNDYGLYQIEIGDGTVVSGSMAGIDWSNNEKYIKVEIDPAGGTNYMDLGTTQLLSVPYALYAASGAPGPQGPQGPAGPAGPAGPTGPAGSLTGPAGGDLSGNYPNPTIGTNKVTAAKIVSGAVGTSELASNAVTSAKIANDAVTAAKIDDMGASSGQVLKWSGSNWAPAADNAGGLSGGTTGRLLKFTNATTAGNSSVSESSSAILLGQSSSPKSVRFYGPSSNAYHSIYEGTNYRGYFGSYSGAAADVDFGTGAGNTSGKVHLVTQASPKLTVSGSGSVGIGTTSPASAYRLDIAGGSMRVTHSNPFIRINNTHATNLSGINFDENGSFKTGIHYNPSTEDLNITHSSTTAGLVFNGASSGYVGIGTFTPSQKLDVAGNVLARTFISKPTSSSGVGLQMYRYNNNNDWALSIASTNNLWFKYNNALASFINPTGTYTSSDRRLKENIQALEPVLNKIKNIDVMRYQMKADERHLPTIGYIAQDLMKEFPEMVRESGSEEDETNYLGVNYGAMSAIAIKGIQEQQVEIEELKKTNLALQQQIQALSEQLDKLESGQ